MSDTTYTPTESAARIAALKDQLDAARRAMDEAKSALDDAAITASQATIDAIASEVRTYTAAITAEDISPARAQTLVHAAASGLSPAQLKRVAEAVRVSAKTTGIVLPAGRYEGLSRGRGWCRLGTGDNAQWADRVDGGYLASVAGKWVVGSSDGFSRKDTTPWTVERIGACWIAN